MSPLLLACAIFNIPGVIFVKVTRLPETDRNLQLACLINFMVWISIGVGIGKSL